jgi:hypothetical protein
MCRIRSGELTQCQLAMTALLCLAYYMLCVQPLIDPRSCWHQPRGMRCAVTHAGLATPPRSARTHCENFERSQALGFNLQCATVGSGATGVQRRTPPIATIRKETCMVGRNLVVRS